MKPSNKFLPNGVYVSVMPLEGNSLSVFGWVSDWAKFLPSVGYDNPVLIAHARRFWSFKITRTGPIGRPTVDYHSYLPMPGEHSDPTTFVGYFNPYKDEVRARAWVEVLRQFSHINFREEFIKIVDKQLNEYCKEVIE